MVSGSKKFATALTLSTVLSIGCNWFVLPTGAYGASADTPSAVAAWPTLRDHLQSLGERGVPFAQRTFNQSLACALPSDAAEQGALRERLAGQCRTVKNVVVLFDVSGSTLSLATAGSSAGSRGGRFSRGCSPMPISPAIPAGLGIGGAMPSTGGRVSPVLSSGRVSPVSSDSALAGLGLSGPVPLQDPADPPSVVVAVEDPHQTKHPILAEAEGLALALKWLSLTGIGPSNLFLLAFDSDIRLPQGGIGFPHFVTQADEYVRIANGLETILPVTGGGTSLAPALRRAIDTSAGDPGNTLLFVVTDGQTSDASQTDALLAAWATNLTSAGFTLDVFTIGAGSIVSQAESAVTVTVTDDRFVFGQTRTSHFSHVSGGSASFSGAQCNDGYLKALTNYRSRNGGKGRYSGAYRDYGDLQRALCDFFTGRDDGAHALWVQSDVGHFWPPKSHQWDAVATFLDQGTGVNAYAYDKASVTLTLRKEEVAGGLLRATDVYHQGRYYLYEPANKLTVAPLANGTFQLTSTDPTVQARIDHINGNAPSISCPVSPVPAPASFAASASPSAAPAPAAPGGAGSSGLGSRPVSLVPGAGNRSSGPSASLGQRRAEARFGAPPVASPSSFGPAGMDLLLLTRMLELLQAQNLSNPPAKSDEGESKMD